MTKRGSILLFIILSLFMFLPTNTFAQDIGVADMDITWLSTTSTGLNHSYTNNYTLGTAVQFGSDPNPYYNITRFGGGVTFTGISQNAIVTARVNYLISSSLPIPSVGNASCMAYSSGMSALTANLQSVTPAYTNGELTGYTFSCYYQYQSLTPEYTFFGIEGPSGGTESMFQGYFTPTQTYLSYNIVDLLVNDPNAANSTIIIQNQEIINQNNQMLDKQQQTNNKLDEAETTRKGIWETIKDIPNLIGEKLKSLFVPSDDYFETKFNELSENVEGILGFLGYPYTLLTNTFDYFMTIEDTGEYIIKWDDVKVPNFEEYSIIKGGSFDFSVLLQDEKINLLRNIAFAFINALLTLAFLQLCHNQYNKIFGGDISTTEFISVSNEYDIDYDTGEVTGMKRIEKTTTRRDVN